jgi:hypothetical protein
MRPTKNLLGCLVVSVAVAAACGSGVPTAPTAAEAREKDVAYLNQVVNAFESYSYFRNQIDWPPLRKQVIDAVQGGTARLDAILLAIRLVNDNHSWYRFPDGSGTFTPFSTSECAANASPQLPFAWPQDVGYVYVGAFGGSAAAAATYAEQIQAAIRDNDRPGNAGWVVDLRHNSGGNYLPMIAGVGPVLGEGLAGYFRYASGTLSPWGYVEGALWTGTTSSRDVFVKAPYRLATSARRVAVLTDSMTNSAGEATAVAFRGRPDTRTFGGETCGHSSGIIGITLSDGGTLGLLQVVDADRLGRVYGGKLQPDETIRDDMQLYARVVTWLRSGQ